MWTGSEFTSPTHTPVLRTDKSEGGGVGGWGVGGVWSSSPRHPAPKGRGGEGARARLGVSLPLAYVTKTMHMAPGSKPLWPPVPSKPRPAQAAPHQLRQTGVNLLATKAVVPNERTPPRRNCGPPQAVHLEDLAAL